MKVHCPHCGQKIECDDQYAGMNVECPCCHKAFTVPQPDIPVGKNPQRVNSTFEVENDICSGHPSWYYYAGYIILGILVAVIYRLSFGIILGLAIIVIAILKRYSQSFTITTKSIKLTNGIFIKQETTLRIQDIRAIAIRRSLWEFFTGCSTVLIGTAATAGMEVKLKHVPDGKYIQAQLNELRDRLI